MVSLEEIQHLNNLSKRIIGEISKVVIGNEEAIKLMIIALLSSGHILLEGVPGVAKTLLSKSFAKALHLSFKRIQCTPDLLPSDIVGTFIFNQKDQAFHFRPGPIFANVILADEINRASPKTQAALLEAMQESQVTIEGQTKPLEPPFIILATQTPVEREGIYPLPLAQLDRFMFRIIIDYPDHHSGIKILESKLTGMDVASIRSVATAEEILRAQGVVKRSVHVSKDILDYIVSFIEATRKDLDRVELGGSPRASTHILDAARALAGVEGRDYVIPDDVRRVAFPVLNHRLSLRPEYLVGLDSRITRYERLREVIEHALSSTEPPR